MYINRHLTEIETLHNPNVFPVWLFWGFNTTYNYLQLQYQNLNNAFLVFTPKKQDTQKQLHVSAVW